MRFHTALRRGYSGLWDWDLSRGAIFWSQSMFEILGLTPENRLLSVGEVAGLIRPEDIDLLRRIRDLLYSEGYTIKGVQRLLREGRGKDDGPEEPPAAPAAEQAAGPAARSGGDVAGEIRSAIDELIALRDLLRSAGKKTP